MLYILVRFPVPDDPQKSPEVTLEAFYHWDLSLAGGLALTVGPEQYNTSNCGCFDQEFPGVVPGFPENL